MMNSEENRIRRMAIARAELAKGSSPESAASAAGLSVATLSRWLERAEGGPDALGDLPRAGRPPLVELSGPEAAALRRAYLKSNRSRGRGSMTAAARWCARSEDTPLGDAARDAILKPRASKHALPVEVRRAMRGLEGAAVLAVRNPRDAAQSAAYVPGRLRRDEETGRMLLPGERQVWDDASVNVGVVVPWQGAGDACSAKFGVRVARFQLLAGIDCATDFFCGFGYVLRISDGYRSCDVAGTMRRVWAQQGFMPRACVLEGGSWQSKNTLEFLAAAGVGVVSAKGRPNQKLIEGYFSRLWTALSLELPGRGQIGRYRNEMAKENLDWAACREGRRDPRGLFPALPEFLAALDRAIRNLNSETLESRTYRDAWVPAERYAEGIGAQGLKDARTQVRADGFARFAMPVRAERQLRRGGMAFVTAETAFEGLRHEYAFAARDGFRFDGAPAVIRFDPLDAEAGADIRLARAWHDWPEGQIIDAAAPCVSAAPDFCAPFGILDTRSAARAAKRQSRASISAIVAAYDPRGRIATVCDTAKGPSLAIRAITPAALRPEAAEAPADDGAWSEPDWAARDRAAGLTAS
jgi:hypothetical protein